MKQEIIPFGADRKIRVKITELGTGIDLEDCNSYTLKFTAGSRSKTFSVSDPSDPDTAGITKVDASTVIVALRTSELDRGDLFLEATVSVPDVSFTGGARTEIVEQDLRFTIQ